MKGEIIFREKPESASILWCLMMTQNKSCTRTPGLCFAFTDHPFAVSEISMQEIQLTLSFGRRSERFMQSSLTCQPASYGSGRRTVKTPAPQFANKKDQLRRMARGTVKGYLHFDCLVLKKIIVFRFEHNA